MVMRTRNAPPRAPKPRALKVTKVGRPKMVKCMVALPEATYQWLEGESAKFGVPKAEIVRRAVDEYHTKQTAGPVEKGLLE